MELASWDDFLKIDMRVGTVLEVQPFPQARKPSFRLRIDFGPDIGVKHSSAQITAFYRPEDLVGRQVVAVVNFPRKQIATFFSEVLVLGLEGEGGGIVLLQPERPVENGKRVH
jgi:tRNA-binding protein